MRSVEMCAGAGGLALATAQVGFTHAALLESDPIACATINENRRRGSRWAKNWPEVAPLDVCGFDYSAIAGPITLLSGGPPCQPYSVAGKRRGIHDDRDLFGEVARAMSELRPRAILIENTKGLATEKFRGHLRYILRRLAFPEQQPKKGESWAGFLARLEKLAAAKPTGELRYTVTPHVLNAADYGVAQRRERLVIVGFQGTDPPPFVFPPATHSLDALIYRQWVTGEYWDHYKIPIRRRPMPSVRFGPRIKRLRAAMQPPPLLPWVTARDVIGDLPEPVESPRDDAPPNHRLVPGARAYPKHTGSCPDFPAKVLKAGRHGVPGGENMLAFPDGRVRYFTIRECARLQTFPDDYVFTGTWKNLTRQVGNAVPVAMCRRVAEAVRRYLEQSDQPTRATGAVALDARPPRRKPIH